MTDDEPTTVVFRVWKPRPNVGEVGGDVIALFPEIEEHNGLCSSYMHIGQHGAADYRGVIAATRPARWEEAQRLRNELEAEPYNYNLKVRKRWTQTKR
jgi:hypothetical protein